MEITLPRKGGVQIPVGELDDKELSWWEIRLGENLEQGTSRYPEREEQQLAAVVAELKARSAGKEKDAPSSPRPTQQAPAPQAMQRAQQTQQTQMSVAGAYADTDRITAALAQATATMNLVAPATACGSLPLGCEVVISTVSVSPDDCYGLQGKFGLGKPALDSIAGAAGVSWDPILSCRLDNGSDPSYCHYRAVGTVPAFDGSLRTLTGEVEIDVRDGSPQIEEIKAKAARGGRDGRPRDPQNQITEIRKFLLRHAESKAKLRAIRSLGLKAAYTQEELRKPFAVARIMFTGRTEDPGMQRLFAEKIAESMTGGRRLLFGNQRPELPSAGHAPPPIEAHGQTIEESYPEVSNDY